MNPRAHFSRAFAFAVLMAAPRWAHASPEFPALVQSEWQLPGDPPQCTLCHQTNTGEAGTATKFFARSLLMHGVIGGNDASLKRALSELKSENVDSDADGVSDYDELRAGTDPNDGPGSFGDFPTPQTGCALVTPNSHSAASRNYWFLALAGTFFALHRRRFARS